MSGLEALQREFRSWLLREDGALPARIVGSHAGSARQRLDVYAEGMKLRSLEVLGEEFHALHALLGDQAFTRLAGAYVAAHPSSHASIRWLGRHMTWFLSTRAPWCERPVLAELAAFEWSKGELVDAADAPVLSIADVAARSAGQWADMRPRFVPASRQLRLHFNVPALWRALSAGHAPPPVQHAEPGRGWLLWRRDLQVHWRSLDEDEAWAAASCVAGASFAELCEGLCRWAGEDGAPLRAATLLKQWLADGLLTSV